MNRKPTPKTELSKLVKFGLFLFFTTYITLSIISVYELTGLCKVLTTAALRLQLIIAFSIAIATSAYLAFFKSEKLRNLKLFMEIAPGCIIFILYIYTEPLKISGACVINLSAILVCDFIASLVLLIFQNLLPEDRKLQI